MPVGNVILKVKVISKIGPQKYFFQLGSFIKILAGKKAAVILYVLTK